jgi:glutamate synthase (NADPH/NADH) small chain
MAEYQPPLSPQAARVEAQRCLYCFDAPCIAACPTGIDVPAFIKRIADGRVAGSARVILESNILGASCARVCPTEVLCEGACVMLDRDQAPIRIGSLQRHATDYVYDNNLQVLHPAAKSSGKRVALIGGGPASLGCAAELARLGHQAVIFEKKPEAGGLNTYGIAYYKMTPEVSLREVDLVKSLGVEIRTGIEVGRDVAVEDLERDFDAIFIGVGLGRTYSLDLPGENLAGVVEALDFIEELRVRPLHEVAVGDRVVVIGCGNTAIDAVTQAKRLGAAHSTIAYRRGEADMPAYKYEYDLARRDGCSFLFNVLPVEIIGRDQVEALRLARTRVGGDGRVEVIEGSEFELPCDMVIKALGQQKQRALLQNLFPALTLAPGGTVQCDPGTGATNIPHVFAGGDEANGGAEVVNAVGDGKRAARGLHVYLGGELVAGPVQTTRYGVARPVGSGLDRPVRVPELEAAYYAGREDG